MLLQLFDRPARAAIGGAAALAKAAGIAIFALNAALQAGEGEADRARVIVTSDGEIDDECSLVRFLLHANDFDVEGIITSSSQYHWKGHRWAGDDWADPYLEAYAHVYPNLRLHDPRYPTPERLRSMTLLGNIKAEGEMEEVTPGCRSLGRTARRSVLRARTNSTPTTTCAVGYSTPYRTRRHSGASCAQRVGL